jgi:3-hydroxyacyl-[acyl-carrier-protein] dehydratase
MLLNDFYTVIDRKKEGDAFRVMLSLDPGHRIFDGHFPGRPVVPGVCLIQMVLELTEIVLANRPLRLTSATQIKFISFIDPRINALLGMRLVAVQREGGPIHITAVISAGETVCFKFEGTFALFRNNQTG